MSRWIAFDQESLAAIAPAAGASAELRAGGDALDAALAVDHDAVVLMPAADPGRVVVAQFRYLPAAAAERERAPQYEAGGFLGLRDEVVYEEEPAPPKKWWQKILD